MSTASLVSRLLVRGDSLAIENGRLRLEAASGAPVPDSWLESHYDQLVAEALEHTGIDALLYDSYSTGNYGARKTPGVTLQFSSLLTARSAYTIFNAELTRRKNTSKGKAGNPLPPRQFRVGKKSGFYKFWQASGLVAPPRLSSFHDYMGNLRGILFTGSFKEGERLVSGSIHPITITHQQLLAAYGIAGLPDNSPPTSRQEADKWQTKQPDKAIQQSYIQRGIQPESTTGNDSYGIRLKGSTGIRRNDIALSILMKPIDQTTDEWLSDYSSSETINHRLSKDDKKANFPNDFGEK